MVTRERGRVLASVPFDVLHRRCAGVERDELVVQRHREDRWSPDKISALNPTVCVKIEGACPGDLLAVRILDIEVDGIGYTGFNDASNPLAGLICRREWKLNTKTVRIKNGFIEWSDRIRIPVRPMIGTLGTAPALEVLSNARGGNHGGNMDVNEVAPGSTVYLPVFVDGALLHIGDVHAAQGDGEINCSGGIECRSKVRLSVDVVKMPERMEWVRIEDRDYIMAVACGRSLEESFYGASREILYWMADEYGFTEEEAYLLMGQVMEARSTQFVKPTRTYICKMPKKYLSLNLE
jgi:acetamidase/formamidase